MVYTKGLKTHTFWTNEANDKLLNLILEWVSTLTQYGSKIEVDCFRSVGQVVEKYNYIFVICILPLSLKTYQHFNIPGHSGNCCI